MAQQIKRLTDLKVKRAKTPGYLFDGGGLYLQISETLTKSWVFRFSSPTQVFPADHKRAGQPKPREMGIGAAGELGVSLAAARVIAQGHRDLVAQGIDPIEVKRDEKAAKLAQLAAQAVERAKSVTFKEAAERYLAAHSGTWSNGKHRDQWPNTLKAYAYPVIGALPVEAVDTALIVKVLTPIWEAKTETATRVRGRIEKILGWATTSGFRSGDNPARWRGHLENLLPAPGKIAKVEHHPALPYTAIGGFMVELAQQAGDAAEALRLLILTATRTSEVIGASWSEIDFDAKVWTIPAERIKAKREHRIPLSAPAYELLKRRHENRSSDQWIFPGVKDKPLSNNAILAMLDRMDRGNITAHGFRSTFRDWAAEQTNFPREVAEMALAHAIPDKVEAAYRRGDLFAKRTKLMEAWAAYALAAPREGKVISMRTQTA